MGSCPDWYGLIQAAKYLGVPPWELMEKSVWWKDRAMIAMTAEHNAKKIIEQNQEMKNKR